MSIKIYNSWKLPHSMDIFEFRKKAVNIFQQEARRQALTFLAKRIATHIDTLEYENTPVTSGEIVKTGLEIIQEWSKTGDNPSIYPSLFLLRNDERNEHYVSYFRGVGTLFNLPYEELHNLISQIDPEISNFEYWNNTDQPEEYTEEEWVDRLKAWEETYDLWEPMNLNGFSILLFNEYSTGMSEALLDIALETSPLQPLYPTPEERHNNLIQSLSLQPVQEAYAKEVEELPEDEKSFSNYLERVQRLKKEHSERFTKELSYRLESLDQYYPPLQETIMTIVKGDKTSEE